MKKKDPSEGDLGLISSLPRTPSGTLPEILKLDRLMLVTELPVHVTPVQLHGRTSVATQFVS